MKNKFNLNELKVTSFVTAIQANEKTNVIGGQRIPATDDRRSECCSDYCDTNHPCPQSLSYCPTAVPCEP